MHTILPLLIRPAAGLMLLLVCLMPLHGQVAALFTEQFDTNPEARGWRTTVDRARNEERSMWKYDDARPGGTITATNGTWESPSFPVSSLAYYRVRFTAQARGACMWAIYYADAEGKSLIADNYFEVPSGEPERAHVFCARADVHAVTARLRFVAPAGSSLTVDAVEVTPLTREEAAALVREAVAAMPALDFAPPADRLRLLPRTVEKLRAGGEVRIVLLGDSIVNDVSNSLFELPLAAAYPKAEIRVITSVLSSRGCDHYQQPEALQRHVLAYKPDLLVIGGISNKDIEAMRSVVRQVREALPAEILIMTPLLLRFAEDPETGKPWALEINPEGTGMRSQQLRLTREEGLALVDLAGPFAVYAQRPDVGYPQLKRDSHHAGLRGKLVLGHILARYLSP